MGHLLHVISHGDFFHCGHFSLPLVVKILSEK
jgi:hypothetical protein